MSPNIRHLTISLYCFLYKQKCPFKIYLAGSIPFQGPEGLCSLSVASELLVSEYFERVTRKLIGELGIRARIPGWSGWIFLFRQGEDLPVIPTPPTLGIFLADGHIFMSAKLCVSLTWSMNAAFSSLFLTLRIQHSFSVSTVFLLDS